jgi:hypothetical protein
MAFTLYQASEMPRITMGATKVERISGDVFRVWVDITNDKVAPTITARAAENFVIAPDLLTIDGSVDVISAGWVENKFRPGASEMIDQKELKRIRVRTGAPGQTTRTIEYILKGRGEITVKYASVKGGNAEKRIALR